jgi:hypothetical protein
MDVDAIQFFDLGIFFQNEFATGCVRFFRGTPHKVVIRRRRRCFSFTHDEGWNVGG